MAVPITVAIFMLVVSPVDTSAAPISVLQFGSSGTGNGQFASPTSVTLDSSGNIYVVDSANHRVQKFNSSGVYQSQFGSSGTGNGQFNTPRSIDFDSSGNIFVLDTANNRVQKFNSSGTYVSQFGSYGTGNSQFDNPTGIAIDASDNIYVADTFNSRVQKFNSSGTYVLQFGSAGSGGSGQFGGVYDVAVDSSGNVYVVDSYNRVQKFNSSGVFQSQFGSAGSSNGLLNTPTGIAVDTSGNIYVVEYANNRVQKFNSSGTYVTKFGSSGSGVGNISNVYGLGLDTSGNVYVPDTGNNRVQKFTDTTPSITVPANSASVGQNFVTISGSCITGMTVTAIVDSVAISPTATCSSSAFSITPGTPLSVGSHSVTATQSDAGSNISSESSAKTFTVTASFSVVDCTDSADLTTLGGGVTPIPQAECEALQDLYVYTTGSSWTDDTNWDSVSDVGTWYGVTRTSTHVTSIALANNHLDGTLPTSIANLTSLTYFSVANNSLITGSIPSLSSNTALQSFYGSSTNLSGTIPSLSSNTALTNFIVSNAQLSGSIPSLSANTALINFQTYNNALTGTIPSLDTNTLLQTLVLDRNQLTGSIPSFTNNTVLYLIRLYDNKLSGSIPTPPASTTDFFIQRNMFTGDIPDLSSWSSISGSFAENGLSTASSVKDAAVDAKFGENWSLTQTIVPTNVVATQSGTDIVVTWDHIEYTSAGSYKVYYGTTQGGPYSTLAGTVARTASATLTVSGLTANTDYYFIVQAYTPANGSQQNIITADSDEALGRVVSSGGSSGSSGSGGGSSSSSSGGGGTVHKYPTSTNSSPISLSLTNIPNATDYIAKLKWSPLINAATMTFSLDPKFVGVTYLPFNQEYNFALPKSPGIYNIYGMLTSSSGDSVSLGPLAVSIPVSKITTTIPTPAKIVSIIKKATAPKTKTPTVVKKVVSTPKTKNTCVLGKYLEPGRVNNDTNEVKLWQNFLNKYEGEELDVNGVYDLLTQEAVFRFQAVNYMKVDGIIGSATRLPANKLLGCSI